MDCRIKSGNDAMESRSRDAFFLRPSYAKPFRKLVIARSVSDEAIQCDSEGLDCFAELVIGPATSGRTRWLAMTTANKIKEAERRQTCIQPPHASGVRRALKRSALACRRSTTALAGANERPSSTPVTRFLGLGRTHGPDGSKDVRV
jgi:hypothetical protein